MRNLFSLLAALGLTATAATTVIACGNKKNHVIQKTALKDLHLKTRLSNPTTDPKEAFESFIELNAEVSDLRDSVSIDVFLAPNYYKEGTLQVQAIPNTNYSGTLTIIIPSLIKTDIANLITRTTIQGVENMTAGGAFQALLDANSNSINLNTYLIYNSTTFVKPGFTKNGSLTVVATANTEYTGLITVTITAIGQTKLSGLTNLITEVGSNTTKDNAFQNFLDLNKTEYPDLQGNITLDESSFVESDYSKPGFFKIEGIPNGKYSGSVKVTIPMKVKVKLENVIKNTQLTGNVSENEVIAKILAANPESGLVASDLRVTTFVAPQIATPGSATINAVDASGFIGSVNITIILVPKDQELTEIINKIKATPPKTLAAIEVWKEYFAYYSQDKIQYLVNLLNTKYIVWRTESDADKRSSLTTQVKGNISNLLDQVIVYKDELGDSRYDDFGIGDTTVFELDSTHNLFIITIPLNFIWNSQNDISSKTTWTETRTIAIKFEQDEKPS